MTAREPANPARRWTLVGLVTIAIATAGVLTACGSDDDAGSDATTTTSAEAAVCTSLDTLGADVDSLKSIDTAAGDGVVAELESSLESIQADLDAVSADAASELSDPIDALQASVTTLSDEVTAAKASSTPGAAASQLLDAAADVSSSWVAVKAAAPDCDL